MKKTREQTQRLIAFWIASLTIVVLALLASSWTAAFSHANRTQEQNVKYMAATMERQFFRNADLSALDKWLPDLLLSYEFSRFRLSLDGDDLYRWQAPYPQQKRQNSYDVRLSNEVRMHITMPKPRIISGFSAREFAIIAAGLVAAFAMVVVGFFWLSSEMDGVERLAARTRRILEGDMEAAAHAEKGERPISASRAISKLYRSWRHEREAKKSLDHYIRANTFLDANLGIGNRSFFEHRLHAFAKEGEMRQQGMVLLVQFDGLEGEDGHNQLTVIKQFIELAQPILSTHFDAVFASRSTLELAILIPQLPLKDGETLIAKLVKAIPLLNLPKGVDKDEAVHIGVAYYNRGDEVDQVISEAEMALRAAQLQGDSGWFMYDKGAVDRELAQGSVRWRSMIENALNRDGLVTEMAPVVNQQGKLQHLEVFSRMRNAQGELVRASLYRPMAWRCGLLPQIELRLIEIALRQLRDQQWPAAVSVNVKAQSLMHDRFIKRLKMLLASYSSRRQQLIVELNEKELVTHADELAGPLKQLKSADCLLAVDGVGQTVESLDYIENFGIDIIKLHASLSQKIHIRPENQLVIGSLVRSLVYHPVKIYAEGVESSAERQRLQMLDVSGYQGALAGHATDNLDDLKRAFPITK
ncbi:EAL domain-containing protein [Ferrimonas aestuarii]|uniref:EAL domain-containing protein n=1 Tax=Ferrimonas aestuarii TaxID=2569539 RepID=A0A4U1BRS0_9GAMM|nr:EAL domain-containing protein [Ferrimonas aestuarii]TKB56002.1 EAL domain-containing protein [Ferrimonas aestuarii]